MRRVSIRLKASAAAQAWTGLCAPARRIYRGFLLSDVPCGAPGTSSQVLRCVMYDPFGAGQYGLHQLQAAQQAAVLRWRAHPGGKTDAMIWRRICCSLLDELDGGEGGACCCWCCEGAGGVTMDGMAYGIDIVRCDAMRCDAARTAVARAAIWMLCYAMLCCRVGAKQSYIAMTNGRLQRRVRRTQDDNIAACVSEWATD